MLTDTFGRVHNYLRISLTDKCNLRCFYCMPEEHYDFTENEKLMQVDEIETLATIFVENGVDKIRLTGGEPLMRKDAKDIIGRLSKLPTKLALTTNATYLHKFVDLLKLADLSLNISLDTLNADTFMRLTRRDLFKQVKGNIDLMVREGFDVKVNMVVMRGVNDAEVNDFVEWTREAPIKVRFIEFMPFAGNRWSSNKLFTMRDILERIAEKYSFTPLPNDPNDTAKQYKVPKHAGDFAVISTMSEPFCAGCNRIRLTADGKLKNCLFSENEIDLLTPLRNGEDILPLIHQTIYNKARELGGQFTSDFKKIHVENIHNRSMIAIGG